MHVFQHLQVHDRLRDIQVRLLGQEADILRPLVFKAPLGNLQTAVLGTDLGQMSRQGRITKQGNALLRTLLVEASWVALRYNPRLRSVYQRITAGSKGRRKVAIVAVARRMLVIAWAMMRDGTEWDASN